MTTLTSWTAFEFNMFEALFELDKKNCVSDNVSPNYQPNQVLASLPKSTNFQEKDAPETQSLPGHEIFIFEWLMMAERSEWVLPVATELGMNPLLKAAPIPSTSSSFIVAACDHVLFSQKEIVKTNKILAAPLIYQNHTEERRFFTQRHHPCNQAAEDLAGRWQMSSPIDATIKNTLSLIRSCSTPGLYQI